MDTMLVDEITLAPRDKILQKRAVLIAISFAKILKSYDHANVTTMVHPYNPILLW